MKFTCGYAFYLYVPGPLTCMVDKKLIRAILLMIITIIKITIL